MELHKRFAIVKLWDTKCAEDENIQRFVETAKALGIECIPVDKNYRYLSDKNKVATEENFDFILHLHFESLKINNLFSFVTIWNPTQFYHELMIPRDEGRNTREFEDHYVIHSPFSHRSQSGSSMSGTVVADNFEYSSGTNAWHLTVEELRNLVGMAWSIER